MAAGRQLGLLWGGVALALLALSPWASEFAAYAPACPFKEIAGAPCATCGATRAAVALAALRPLEALALNPLSAIAWAVLVGGGLVAIGLVVLGRELPGLPRRLPIPVRLGAVLAFAANWAYVVLAGT